MFFDGKSQSFASLAAVAIVVAVDHRSFPGEPSSRVAGGRRQLAITVDHWSFPSGHLPRRRWSLINLILILCGSNRFLVCSFLFLNDWSFSLLSHMQTIHVQAFRLLLMMDVYGRKD